MARSGPHVRQPTSRMAPGSMEIRPTGLHRHPERRKASLQELIARAQRVRTRRDGAVEVDQRVVLVVLGPRWQAGPVRVAGLGMRTRFLPPPRASLGSGHICRRESDCRVAGSDLCRRASGACAAACRLEPRRVQLSVAGKNRSSRGLDKHPSVAN